MHLLLHTKCTMGQCHRLMAPRYPVSEDCGIPKRPPWCVAETLGGICASAGIRGLRSPGLRWKSFCVPAGSESTKRFVGLGSLESGGRDNVEVKVLNNVGTAVSPLELILMKNAPVSPLELTLTKLLDLKWLC